MLKFEGVWSNGFLRASPAWPRLTFNYVWLNSNAQTLRHLSESVPDRVYSTYNTALQY